MKHAVFALGCTVLLSSGAFAQNGTPEANICAVESWCNSTCLAAGTMITTVDNKTRPIEQINQGDRVLSLESSPNGGSLNSYRTSLNLQKTMVAEVLEKTSTPLQGRAMMELRVASGQVLRATENHPIITSSGVRAMGNLNVGDTVYTDKGISAVTSIKTVDYSGNVYNLATSNVNKNTVVGYGVFYANGILVGDLNAQRALGY